MFKTLVKSQCVKDVFDPFKNLEYCHAKIIAAIVNDRTRTNAQTRNEERLLRDAVKKFKIIFS